MNDLFNLVAATCVFQMAIILAMVEADRDYKRESAWVLWSRRIGFGVGVATLFYSGITHNWQIAALLMASACVVIFSVNIVSLRTRNKPPLHGHRLLARTAAFWRRYP